MQIIPAIKTPNLAIPSAGSEALPYRFEFGANTSLDLDLTQSVEFQKIAYLQSVFIDNADNSADFDLTFYGAQYPQRIRARAYSQGWYPISWPVGASRLRAQSQAGVNVPVIFGNFAMPYYQDAPTDGALVVPPLTNAVIDEEAIGAGGEIELVAGVPGETVSFYRGMIEVDTPTVLRFLDGSGGTVLYTALLTAGGAINFAGSGVSWFATSAGNGLFLSSTAAVNAYGGFGYVQA